MRPALKAYQTFWNILDWVFPPECPGCHRLGERWCERCQAQAARLGKSVCEACGDLLPQPGLCSRCRANPPAYIALRSWCIYQEGARDAIHQLKFRRDVGLADALAKPMIDLLASLSWAIDAVVPVPLSSTRRRQRGYNQSSLLARPLSLASGVPFKPGLLARVRETNPQVGLSAQDRCANVHAAFQAALAQGMRVLVVDDVITTGSTMNACAQALISAGASQVYGISFARAVLPDQLVQSQPSYDQGGTNGSEG